MKIVESWLRQWVDPGLDSEALANELTMLGHEVDSIHVEGEGLAGVVVAEVLDVARHPDADRLHVCQVSTGNGTPLEVVCGAPNVFAGMKTPLALPGVTLPNGLTLRKATIRGVVSNGMLCSATELGLGAESDGIMSLPDDAPSGVELMAYLGLPDTVIDVDLTPNRGDCFSVLGIARDIAALTGAALKSPDVAGPAAASARVQLVELPVPEACPVFAGRVVEGIDPAARSPLWLVERLRRAGLREISPVVDVTNYVMLELGQPLHGYDADRITGTIRPRLAAGGESLTLLDEHTVELSKGTVVITDDRGVIGLAGIMGGLSTAVTAQTRNVFFEAAFWPRPFMAGRARSYHLHTDAALRFERGVDPMGQARAVERAAELLLSIAGGRAGPLLVETADGQVPTRPPVRLRRARIEKLLGMGVPDADVEPILERLGCRLDQAGDGWQVTPPGYRFDLEIEADLIEEIARLVGYDKIPQTNAIAATPLAACSDRRVADDLAAQILIARDYQEAITYSFVDAAANAAISGTPSEFVLSNPISSELGAMRASLWPGLIKAAAMNLAHQQDRVRLFEMGKSFHGSLDSPIEVRRIAGLALGPSLPEQWGAGKVAVDFFDVKADVSAILAQSGPPESVEFVAVAHHALQPGQCASIQRDGAALGWIGKLHPRVAEQFDIKPAVYLFELDADKALAAAAPQAGTVSKFPTVRRDLAVLVACDVQVNDLEAAVKAAAPALIKRVVVFDIYTGPGIEPGLKSVALGLILQETSRTLTAQDADAAMLAAAQKLQSDFAAVLRD